LYVTLQLEQNLDRTKKITRTILHFNLQVFFVIRLQSSQALLQAIRDPDPLVQNDLMDGRDAFLMSAREKHYEFSTLRRAKFSSMAMLYELHTSGRDSFVYTCNVCKANMETHYHCSTCDVSDLAAIRQCINIIAVVLKPCCSNNLHFAKTVRYHQPSRHCASNTKQRFFFNA
jgi:hypothetical protein